MTRASGVLRDRVPADQQAVRRSNLGLVLRHIRDHGARSRARIAAETGLNKATVSSLVAELVERGLLRDGALVRDGQIGRPGQRVELDGRGICGVGVELGVGSAAVLILDLAGRVLVDQRRALDVAALGPERTLRELADLVIGGMDAAGEFGSAAVGVTLAVPALVDSAGALAAAPNLGPDWSGLPVALALAERLAERPGARASDLLVCADNEANLAALGEYAIGASAGEANLVSLTGEVGVGGGVIVDGVLLRGAAGFGGEVGHVVIDPDGARCRCGCRGCWETLVGLPAFLRAAADPADPVRAAGLDPQARLAELRRRADEGDGRTLGALRVLGRDLGLGVSVLVNLFNPSVVVLGGYFASFGPHLLELADRVVAPHCGGARVEVSRLGASAAARGGAHVALEAVLADPTLVGPVVATASRGGRPRRGGEVAYSRRGSAAG